MPQIQLTNLTSTIYRNSANLATKAAGQSNDATPKRLEFRFTASLALSCLQSNVYEIIENDYLCSVGTPNATGHASREKFANRWHTGAKRVGLSRNALRDSDSWLWPNFTASYLIK